MPITIRVTVIEDGYIKERCSFAIKNFNDMQDYSFCLLDLKEEYGDSATIRVEEVKK